MSIEAKLVKRYSKNRNEILGLRQYFYTVSIWYIIDRVSPCAVFLFPRAGRSKRIL
jgi:hypothetical protein